MPVQKQVAFEHERSGGALGLMFDLKLQAHEKADIVPHQGLKGQLHCCDTGRWQTVRLQYIKFSSKI